MNTIEAVTKLISTLPIPIAMLVKESLISNRSGLFLLAITLLILIEIGQY